MRSKIEWIAWGKTDPLYSVASWPGKQKSGQDPWTLQDFYATGELEWQAYVSQWSQYGFDRTCCVEIGCGAGRFTGPLTECFKMVHAVDVSPDMIELAQKRAPQARFYLTGGLTLPVPDGSATAVFSTFVFRHFDRLSEAVTYFREVHRVLVAGGTMLIELPIYILPTRGTLMEIGYRLKKTLGDILANFRRFWIQRGLGKPIMRELRYEIGWLFRTLEIIGFSDLEVRVFRLGADQNWHTFVFARRGMKKS